MTFGATLIKIDVLSIFKHLCVKLHKYRKHTESSLGYIVLVLNRNMLIINYLSSVMDDLEFIQSLFFYSNVSDDGCLLEVSIAKVGFVKATL